MFSHKYLYYLRSEAWKEKRQQVFLIQGSRCKTCGTTRRLEINHKHYRTLFKEDPATDLEVLCHNCHLAYHKRDKLKKRAAAPILKAAKRSKRKQTRALARFQQEGVAMTMDEYRKRGNRYLSSSDRRYRKA